MGLLRTLFPSGKVAQRQRVELHENDVSLLAALSRDGGGGEGYTGLNKPKAYDVNRAREIAVMTPYGRRFLSLCRANAVGADGIRLLHSNTQIQAVWDEWIADCGMGGVPFAEIQAMSVDALVRDGEILVDMPVIRRDDSQRVELSLRDSVSLNYDTGIDFDRSGRPRRYRWQEGGSTPADEIAHVFHADNIGDLRGTTWFKGAFTVYKQLKDFQTALVCNATLTANQSGMFVLPDGYITSDLVGDDPDASEYSEIDEEKIRISVVRKAGEDAIVPMGTEWLPINRGVGFSYGTDFTAIRSALLGEFAAALGISYHALAGDVSNANFSSLRHGRIEDIMLYERVQGYIARLIGIIYERWALIAQMMGQIGVEAKMGNSYEIVKPAPAYIEPVKEVTADKLAVEAGLASRTQIIRSRGKDPETVFNELIAERDMLTPVEAEQGNEGNDAERSAD